MIDRYLANGMRILLHPGKAQECVNIVLAVAAGSVNDGSIPGCGTAHWVEHLLFDGCKKFPGDAAVNAMARLGASSNAMTGLFRTEYTVSVCPEDLARALEILSSMISGPEFAPEKIEHERSVILRETGLFNDDGEMVLDELLYSAVYRGTPLAEPVAGNPEAFAAAPAAAPVDFYRKWYQPCRMVLVMTGGFEPSEGFRLAEKYFSGGEAAAHNGICHLPAEKPAAAGQRLLKKFPDPETARIAIGFPFAGGSRKEFLAGGMLASLLAWNDSSILDREFCRKKTLARDMSATLDGDGSWGIFKIEAECEPAHTANLEEKLLTAISNFDIPVITAEAVEAEKLQCSAVIRSECRDPALLAGRIAERATLSTETSSLPDPFEDEKLIREITLTDIRNFAEKYMIPAKLSTAILAPDLRRVRRSPVAGQDKFPTGGQLQRRHSVPRLPESSTGSSFPGKTLFLPDRSGMVDLSLLLPCAGTLEMSMINGISQLTCRVLNAGPTGWGEERWLRALDTSLIRTGAEFTSSAIHIEAAAPVEKQEQLFAYILELLASPAWCKNVIRREASALSGEWKGRLASTAMVFDRARKLLFGDHPAGSAPGDWQKIRTATPQMLADYYSKAWIPGWVTAGFGGEYSEKTVCKFLSALAEKMPWQKGNADVPGNSLWTKPEKDITATVPLAREQCVCVCMIPGPAHNEKEALAAFRILDYAEGGLSGRIFRIVREKYHLAYAVETGTVPGFGCGAFYFSADCEYNMADKVLGLFAGELDHVAAGGISRQEFEQAKAEEKVSRAMGESNRLALCARKTLDTFCGTEDQGFYIDNLTFDSFTAIITEHLRQNRRISVKAVEAEQE